MVVSAGNFPVLVHHAVLCNLHPLGCFSTHLFAEALQAAGKISPVPVYLVKISGCWLVAVVVCKRDRPVAFPEIRIGQLAEIPSRYHVVILLLRNGGCQLSFAAGARGVFLVRCFKEIHFCIIGCSENVFLFPNVPCPHRSLPPSAKFYWDFLFCGPNTHGFAGQGGHNAGQVFLSFPFRQAIQTRPRFLPLDPRFPRLVFFCGR